MADFFHELWAKLRKKKAFYALLLCVFLFTPAIGAFEDDRTIMLARTLYALGQFETAETQRMLGSAIMNRVDDFRFPDTVEAVLNGSGGLARGMRYDERAYAAAREVLMGKRTLPEDCVYWIELNGEEDAQPQELIAQSGRYGFYR